MDSAPHRSTAFPLQFRDAPEFERFVFRALATGAVFGVLHAIAGGFRIGVPAWLFVGPPVLLAAPRASWNARIVLAGVMAIAGLVALGVLGGPPLAIVFGAFAGGTLFVLRRAPRDGTTPPTEWHLLAAIAFGAVAVPCAEWIVGELWRQRPDLFGHAGRFGADWLLAIADGLLLSLVALPLHVHARGDALLEEARGVVSTLRGRFRGLGDKVLDHARECRALLAQLPPGKGLEELEATFEELLKAAVQHLREWAGVEADITDPTAAPTSAELDRLRSERSSTEDGVTRQHLEIAIATLEEEVQRMSTLRQSRRRAVARLEAQAALLARVRGALIGVKSGHAEVRSVELAALARRLSAQSTAQSLEGEVMREVAQGAELDQLAAR